MVTAVNKINQNKVSSELMKQFDKGAFKNLHPP